MVIVPYIIAFFAVLSYALLIPLAKKIGFNLPPFTFVATSSAIITVIAGSIGFLYERTKVVQAMPDIQWKWLVLFSLINIVGYVLYLVSLSKIPVAHYSMLGILTPVISGVFAYLLLQEPFHSRYFLALGFMAVGLGIALGPELWGKE